MANFLQTVSGIITKTLVAVEVGLDNTILKAKKNGDTAYHYTLPRKSIMVDVSAASGYSGLYREKGSLISFDLLRQLYERDMIVTAIINKMCNRVAAFANPQKNKQTLGFLIKPRVNNSDLLFNEKKIDGVFSREQLRDIDTLTSFLIKTGTLEEKRPKSDQTSFETFLRLIVKDRLIYNQIAIECIPTVDGESIDYFTHVAGGSIRYATSEIKDKNLKIDDVIDQAFMGESDSKDFQRKLDRSKNTDHEDIAFVQVNKGQVCAVFTEKELIYRHGIPSNELCHNGYSPGELETLINTVANHRLSEAHNESFFKFGYAGNGILNIKTQLTEDDLQGLKRQFERQYQGTRNAFKMPIMSAKDGIEWIQTGQNNKDMGWSDWVEYLIKQICGVYGLNPAEINFDISKGSANTLGDGGQRNEVMLRDTRNSMLRPLLTWIESIINDDILPRFNKDLSEKYVFEFVGLDDDNKDLELDRKAKRITTYKTVNEERKDDGLAPLEDGDIILNPVYLQWKQYLSQFKVGQKNNLISADGVGNSDDITQENNEEIDFKTSKSTSDFIFNIAKSLEKDRSKLVKVEWFNE